VIFLDSVWSTVVLTLTYHCHLRKLCLFFIMHFNLFTSATSVILIILFCLEYYWTGQVAWFTLTLRINSPTHYSPSWEIPLSQDIYKTMFIKKGNIPLSISENKLGPSVLHINATWIPSRRVTWVLSNYTFL
jgi:hypothetical protein